MSSGPDYHLTRSDPGVWTHVRTRDGSIVPLDGRPEFQTFCEWAARQDSPVGTAGGALPARATFCRDVESVVVQCKSTNITLYARPPAPAAVGGRYRLLLAAALESPDQGPLCRLARCVAARGDERGADANGLLPAESNLWVTPATFAALDDALRDDDSDVRRVSNWPIRRAFMYLDVSDFSNYRPGQQSLVINSILALVTNPHYWVGHDGHHVRRAVEAHLCIGDGYIFVFKTAGEATFFAAYLACLIEVCVARRLLPVEFHFRIGVHVGPVYSFWDTGRGGWNYIGEGINGGNRVLSVIEEDKDDVVFVSAEVRQELIELENSADHPYNTMIRALLDNRGRRTDKHGRHWRVYELSHMALFHDRLPDVAAGPVCTG